MEWTHEWTHEGREEQKAWKAKTPAEIYQLLEGNISTCQWKLILAGLVPSYSTRMMKMKQEWTFQQENDPKHSQGNSQENIAARMASQSPDLNPEENQN